MKDAYYFSHDSNARHDPKISAMRGVYGAEGYGWYWMFIEMMRDADSYRLDMQSKYTWNAYAMQMHTDCTRIEAFVLDCINEFNLFESDGVAFWAPSLIRRMDKMKDISSKRSKAAKTMWDKKKSESEDTEDMQMYCNEDANVMQNDAKESKGKESKRNRKEIKDKTFSAYTSNPLLIESLESFIEFRKKVKKPMGDRAIKLLLGNLDKLASTDEDKIAILDQSILNGWQSVYAIKSEAADQRQYRPRGGKPTREPLQTIKPDSNGKAPPTDEEMAALLAYAEKLDRGEI